MVSFTSGISKNRTNEQTKQNRLIETETKAMVAKGGGGIRKWVKNMRGTRVNNVVINLHGDGSVPEFVE